MHHCKVLTQYTSQIWLYNVVSKLSKLIKINSFPSIVSSIEIENTFHQKILQPLNQIGQKLVH